MTHIEITDYLTRLSELEEALEGIEADNEEENEDDDHDAREKATQDQLQSILRDLCTIVREAEELGDSDLEIIVTRADDLINQSVNLAYGSNGMFDEGMFEFLPSFAHSATSPLVEDGKSTLSLPYAAIEGFLALIREFSTKPVPEPGPGFPAFTEPWKATKRPHSKTSPLARYLKETTPPSATASNPVTNAIYEAKCEVSCNSTCMPIRLRLSSDASCMALSSAGGWKNRSPQLTYYLLNDDSSDFPDCYEIDIGLESMAYHTVIDANRKLIFAADKNRIKSFIWPTSPKKRQSALPVHTMNSISFEGPLHLIDGRVFRAGQGSVAVWNIDQLETHGPQGTKRIGKKIHIGDSWRDDVDEIELSEGSEPNNTIACEDKSLKPAHWHPHPSKPGSMLCSSDVCAKHYRVHNPYSCIVLELESGKTAGRYLGHGGEVTEYSTSESDPNVFLTACGDGYARLYDVRHHLPALTLNVGKQGEFCDSAILCHPDGIPTVFTGTERSEHITMWDIRAQTAVYELATGNNAVTSMVWDSKRNSLYAATECNYIDRNGIHYEYRKAKIPKTSVQKSKGLNVEVGGDDEEADDDDDDDDDDNYDESDDDDEWAWPKKAFHKEDYFGYTFDAGEHRIFRYRFKDDADPNVTPPYGDANVHRSYMW